MAKNEEGQVPDTEGTQDRTGGDVHVAGYGTVEDATPAPVEKFKLTKVKEEDAVIPALITLEFTAEGTYSTDNGEILRTGDRRVVNAADAQTLLDAKVNGKPAFTRV